MQSVAYYNGEIAAPDQLKIPFLDRVCFYGDGVYDATMVRDGAILFLDEHLDRFESSMAMLRFQVPGSRAWLAGELQRMVDMCDARDQLVYWQVTRGTAPRQHPFADCPPNLWIMAAPHAFADLDQAVDVFTFEDKRFSYCNAKTLNLLPNVLAAQNAVDQGGQEAVFVRDGYVTESAHSNIHILVGGELVTHPADEHILPGIARRHLLGACERLGVPVQERLYTLEELLAADEVLLSASSTFAQRVAHVDGSLVGGRDQGTYDRLRAELEREFDEYVALHANRL